ncbi:MAG: SUMF1/EgtB/PvdO family nonheme iron enzyme [Nitrospiraceae bacterium]|nr:SUMF1/EgtB/PvdO family nonheme iron enzyme [Nitrospiraceae bacterium]
MDSTKRIWLLTALIGLPALLVALALMLIFEPETPLWVSANLVAGLDRMLGSWTVFPPLLSWMFLGFVVGGAIYFAVWEADKLGRVHLRQACLVAAGLLLLASPLVWPALEVMLDAPTWWRFGPRTPAPGEERSFAGIEFVWIPPGRFRMGSRYDEAGREDDETPHVVTITRGFWLGKHEVTQAQWTGVMGENPSHFQQDGAERPVERVSWDDCREFMRRMNAKGGGFRLPTEAEWEYAARAGRASPYAFGSDPGQLAAHAWYEVNSGSETHPVATARPNAWGLYDMAGNVWEWCNDYYGAYPDRRVADPAGPEVGQYPVLRGGGWTSDAGECRAARRTIFVDGYYRLRNDIGLRLARSSDETIAREAARRASENARASEEAAHEPPER